MSPSLILSHPAYRSLYKTPHMYAISSVRISILHTSVLQRTYQCRHHPLLALLVVGYDSGRRRLPVLGPSSTPPELRRVKQGNESRAWRSARAEAAPP